MKKSFLKKCTLFMALILAFSVLLTGCDLPWEEPEIYKLSYAIDGKIYEIEVKHGENYHLEEIPQREGYDFSGLFDTEEGGTKYVSSSGLCVSAFTDDKNMILYPRWEAKRFTLQLNYGKASDAGLHTLDIAYDQEVQGLPEELDVIGENFLGWYTAQDTSGTKIENGMLMNKTLSALADANGRITLYALFETTKYNVRFYSYDGNTLLEETQVEHGTDISEVAPKALSDGTEILGWSTSRNGFGYDFVGEITGTVTSFYVKYYNCTLTLDPANGDPTQTFTGRNGRDQTLPQPTRTGYTLQGWENEEGKRIDPYVPYRPSKSETLTAKWSPNTYTVTFSVDENIATLQGGEGETSTAKTTFDEEYKFPKPTVTDDLYTFMGWFTENDVQLTDEEGNGLGKWHIDGDITAVARFSKIQYTVSFFTGGGSSVPSKTVDKGSSVQLPKPTFAGYTFGGWKTADGNILQGESFTPSSSVTLTAVWDPNEYTVTLQTDGGKLSGSSETKVKVTFGKAFSLPPASKENFEFLGWYDRSTQLTNANGVGLAVWNIAEDVTLTAQYRRIEYTITFNTNGGTSVGAKTAYKGEPMELPACTKEGYTFNYWKTSSGTKVTSPYMATGSITLYADWTANTYTILLNAQGGTVDASAKVTYDSSFNLPIPEKSSCIFNGWYLSISRTATKLTGATGESIKEYKYDHDITAYAMWVSDVIAPLSRVSCADKKDYNPSSPGSERDEKTHAAFELVQVVLGGVAKTSSDKYFVPQGSTLSLSLNVLQNIGDLPKSGAIGLNWYTNEINDDTCTSVYGTGISGKVGKGAYSIVIEYSDKTTSEITATNFLKGISKGGSKGVSLDVNSAKIISSIKVTVVYEIIYSWYDGGWHDAYSNWRCEKVFDFDC